MAGIFVCLRAFGCNIDLSVQLLVVAIRVPELVEEILKSDVYRGHIVSPVFSSGAGSVGDGYSEKGRLVGVGSVGATSQFTARHGNTW